MFKEVIQVKKVVSVLLAAGIIATTGAFAENVGVSSPAASPVASPVAGAVSSIIDFADGNFGFLGMDTTLGNADASELSVVDYNGGKALRVSPAAAGRVPYVSLNVEGLLGENLSRLAKITFDVGVELGTDGKFYAQSGKVYMVNGEDSSKQSADWSVYMERKNPKTAVVTVPAGAFVAGRGGMGCAGDGGRPLLSLRRGERGGVPELCLRRRRLESGRYGNAAGIPRCAGARFCD